MGSLASEEGTNLAFLQFNSFNDWCGILGGKHTPALAIRTVSDPVTTRSGSGQIIVFGDRAGYLLRPHSLPR